MSRTRGVTKKPPLMCSDDFRRLFKHFSKAAITDALWCACHLGTNDTADQITVQAARNLLLALEARQDYIPPSLHKLAATPIDSDGDVPYATTGGPR